MHELSRLEETALRGYQTYNFPQGTRFTKICIIFSTEELRNIVVNSIINFSNITLSSLYFDITKDCLYADHKGSKERRAIITVLEQVHFPAISMASALITYLLQGIGIHDHNHWTHPPSFSRRNQRGMGPRSVLRVHE